MSSVSDLLQFRRERRTPLVRQAEASECGLACIAMVAAHHGLQVDMPALRRHFGFSLRGATLKTVMDTAERLGFGCRPLRGELEALRDVSLPAILHWDMSHFVVLTRITRTVRGRRFHIHDPAAGTRVLAEGELSRSFTGVLLELRPTAGFRPQAARSPLRIGQLWTGMQGAVGAFASVLTLSVVLQLVALVMPFFLQLAVDTVLPASDLDLLTVLAIGFGGLAVISAVAGWLRSVAILNMTNSFSFQIIDNLYRHLLSLPLAWHQKRHVGDIVSRFGSTQPITEFIGQGAVASVIDGAMALLTLVLMFIYSPVLCGLVVAAWLIYAAIRWWSFAAIRASNVDAITAGARENSAFIESMRGITTIKSFGQEGGRRRRWQSLKAAAINAQLRIGRTTARFDALSTVVLAGERVLFIYVAVKAAMRGDLTVGMIFAFQAYKQQFIDAATRLTDQAVKYRLIDVHLGRIADIALSRPERLGMPERDSSLEHPAEIELRSVCFSYGAGDPDVLRNVGLRVLPGEFVAFVGPSGGGKSTLLKIMMGLLEPTSGVVLVGGRPLDRVGLRAWRSSIGSILQEDQLFAGSLIENISFFDPEPDMDRVREACRDAAVLQEIEAMPANFETLVGDMGSSLSGGQRQRIMLARALYRRPATLFMDEGTANLDHVSEAKVVDSLSRLAVTRIVSAHRSGALQAATRIMLVRDGGVEEIERHPSEVVRNGAA